MKTKTRKHTGESFILFGEFVVFRQGGERVSVFLDRHLVSGKLSNPAFFPCILKVYLWVVITFDPCITYLCQGTESATVIQSQCSQQPIQKAQLGAAHTDIISISEVCLFSREHQYHISDKNEVQCGSPSLILKCSYLQKQKCPMIKYILNIIQILLHIVYNNYSN